PACTKHHALSLTFLSSRLPHPPTSPLFPYTTLFRSKIAMHDAATPAPIADPASLGVLAANLKTVWDAPTTDARLKKRIEVRGQKDRKSTRLNSSHVAISYAVFCLKKKKKRIIIPHKH